MSFEKSSLKIPSVTPNWNLDSWLYVPTAGSQGQMKPVPVIVMAHGLTCTKLMGLSTYAEAFVAAGYACLVFDYRRWGASDGSPRSMVVVSEQLEDYRTVIKYARQQPEFDPQRIIVWGSSFSGAHAVTLASEASLNVAAAISQCGYMGLSDANAIPRRFAFLKTLTWAVLDAAKQSVGLNPVYIPSGAPPGQVAGLTAVGFLDNLTKLVKNKEDWINEVSASSIFQVLNYKAYTTADSITAPFLLVSPEDDNICLIKGAEMVLQAAKHGELLRIPSAGHFDIYPGFKDYDLSLNAQLEFLKKHVPV